MPEHDNYKKMKAKLTAVLVKVLQGKSNCKAIDRSVHVQMD